MHMRRIPSSFRLNMLATGKPVFALACMVALARMARTHCARRRRTHRCRQSWFEFAICVALAICLTLTNVGCRGLHMAGESRPSRNTIEVGRVHLHTDFNLPRRHRLIQEIRAKQAAILSRLRIGKSDESVDVFLFENEPEYQRFVQARFPLLPRRRAFFLKDDTQLSVYAHWNPHVSTDISHEVTHGLLHSVIPNLPLWLDEGLAEYFEVTRGNRGLNRDHVLLLVSRYRQKQWSPNLSRLESITQPGQMSQIDYAESWLWAHLLMESTEDHLFILREYLSQLENFGEAISMNDLLNQMHEDLNDHLLAHLLALANELQTGHTDSTSSSRQAG